MDKALKRLIAIYFKSIISGNPNIIWLDSDGPRPEGLYYSLKITPVSGPENDEYINQQDGSIKQITRAIFNLSIQAYRDGALSGMYELRKTLRKNSYLDKFSIDLCGSNYKINIGRTNDVVDNTGLVETNHEERALMEITLNYTESFIDDGVDDSGLGTQFPVIISGKHKKLEDQIVVENITTITK